MKDLDTFLAEVRGIGVKLWVEGGRLKLRAPEGVLTPELTDALRERKAEILALLRPQPAYAIPPVAAAESYELSAAQRRLWVLAQFPEASAAYNIPLHQFLEGSLDVVALEEALNRLVRRHESLRTTFIAVDGEPRQVVHAELRTPLEFRDLEDLEHPEEAARQLGRQAAVEPFDLENGPLLKAGLLRLGPELHILLFTLHHIVSDGVSIGVLTRDLSELYEAARTGRRARLPPLSIGYTAYTVWQNQRLADEFMAVHRRYWLVKLSGELPVLDLPADYPRPPVQTFRGRELSFTLPAGRLEALRAYCRERSASLFMALHAVLKVLLFAYTGKPDLIIGSPVAGRDHPDLNDQIGLYLNTLALRDPIHADQTFEQFFAQVRQTTTEAFDHGIYPFDRLVNELHLKRDLSRFPLFDVVLILQNQDEPGLTLGEISARPVFEHPGTSKFDLTFCFKESPAGLILGLEFNTDLFREDRIRCVGNHVLTLIGSILGNPDQAVGRLNLLTDAERRQLLDEFNRTAAPYPRDRTLVDLLETVAAETPDARALVSGSRQLTYRELHGRANQLARHLRALGVGPETPVGLHVERSPELVVGLLGILKAGGAYVPLDPVFPRDRLAYMVEDAGIAVLLTRGGEAEGGFPGTRRVDLDGDWARIADYPEDAPPRRLLPHHPAYTIYTSGSTGKPKGVRIPHRALVNFLMSMADRPGLARDDVLLAVTTLSFDIAGLELYLPLLRGARVVLAETADVADGRRLAELLRRSQATVMQATPATWRLLLASGWEGGPQIKVLCGGEALPGDLAEALLACCGAVWNLYGPTETTVWSTAEKLDATPGVRREAVESIGRPIANTEIYLLDPQLRPVPLGVPGDLYIGGDGLALDYANRPELTAEKFLPHPFFPEPGRRIYKTGDTARYRPDGRIEFLGRTDKQVKLRGFRIELGEIEAVLASHPGIEQAVAAMRNDGTGDPCLVAWYLGEDLSSAQLREHVQGRVPQYMVPARFLRVDAFPLTPNGKVDRKALAEPEPGSGRAAAYEPPRTTWEQRLVRLWEEVLNVPRVGIHDNFFELGGHSLKATAFLAGVHKETGARIGLIDVFRQPTVAALACLAEERGAAALPAIGRIEATAVPHSNIKAVDGSAIRPATAEEQELLNQ